MSEFTEKVLASINEAKAKIEQIRKEDSLVFPIFTDLHTEDVGHEYSERLLSALELIKNSFDYDALIDLGDNFSMLGRDIHITNDELESRFVRVLSAIYEAQGKPIINVNGNHDAPGTDFFKPDFWNRIVKWKYGNDTAVYDDCGAYYYIDYEKADTRLVVLSLPCDSDIEAEMPTPIWGFGEKQLKWLKDTALDTNKNVIILSHVPFYDKYTGDMEATLGVWTGEVEKVSYISALCGWIEDLDQAVEIIEEKAGKKLVAVLSGHTHLDDLFMPYEEKNGSKNPLPCPQVVTTATCFTEGKELEIGISIDVAVWTPSKRELNMIRIGDGEDRRVL